MMTRHNNRLRIIAGQWRRRYLYFPEMKSLRPTPDRVRETVFNCLAPYIQQANCLDLFAGSGALGFEALSRGAKQVSFIDQSRTVIRQLEENCHLLNIEHAKIMHMDAIRYLQSEQKSAFDIIFIDPPFRQGLAAQSCRLLQNSDFLMKPTYIYVEVERDFERDQLPKDWQLIKQQTIGQLTFYLMKNA